MRPSDARRSRVAGALGRDYAAGRLGTDTFELRLARALEARSSAELRALREDTAAGAGAAGALRRWWRALLAPAAAEAGVVEVSLRAAPHDGPLTIGRSSTCRLVVDAPEVSRRHAELRRRDGRWVLVDLDSTNGTWLGGWRVTEAVVDAGTEVVVGETRLRFGA